MYCIHNGKSCVMVYDVEKGKYVYITEKRWDKMKREDKARYKMYHTSPNTLDKASFLASCN